MTHLIAGNTNQPSEYRMFASLYHHADVKKIEFKPEWNNGTAYLSKLVYDDVLESFGDIGRFYDPESKRHGVVLKTHFGNAVLFERYTLGERYALVTNLPDEVRAMLVITSNTEYDEFVRLFSNCSPTTDNFAIRFGKMMQSVNAGTAWQPMHLKRKAEREAKKQATA